MKYCMIKACPYEHICPALEEESSVQYISANQQQAAAEKDGLENCTILQQLAEQVGASKGNPFDSIAIV